MQAFADDIWLLDGDPIGYWAPPIPVRFTYAQRAIVVRLDDGTLFVDSPVQLDDARKAAVDALGDVRYIASPNKLHHLHMGAWLDAYPEAAVYASPGLPKKRPDLRFDSELSDEPEPAWAGQLEQCVFRGSFFMEEVVFFHRASSTLILGDMVENHDPEVLASRRQRFFARLNGMLAPNGTTPINFRASFTRRSRARESLATIRSWSPERLVLLHGPCVEHDAKDFIDRAFAWLD